MKTLCPVCCDILLHHLCRHRTFWFCPRCRQEMPNLDLIESNPIQKHFILSPKYLNKYKNTASSNQVQNNPRLILHQPKTVNSLINENEKRLAVVNFITSQIDLIINHTFSELEQYTIELEFQSNQILVPKIKPNTSTKTAFLRDSKIILLSICQAILLADSFMLNRESLAKLKSNYIKLQLPVEQSCFLDLIKTSVIDFIRSITIDSPQNIRYLIKEISGYFEIAIALTIELDDNL